jgi:tetratricopeptide (TPR) repeat protein
MKLDREDRIAPAASSPNHALITAALTAAIAAVVAFIAFPELRDYAWRQTHRVASSVGLVPADNEFAGVYKKLSMAPLPADLAASSRISPHLAKLATEPCDKKSIFALGEALIVEHEERGAANAYLGFAAACPNGEGEEYRAAQILFQLGDNEKVITIASGLVLISPGIADYRYLRGKAMAGVKRYDEALADYASTIKLSNAPHNLREGVFTEMANIYLSIGKPCEAAATILAWVAIAPTTRNTPAIHTMIEEYKAQGCQQNAAPPDLDKL